MTMPLMRPKRKNPVLRTRQMNLPPWARGRVALGITGPAESAQDVRLTLSDVILRRTSSCSRSRADRCLPA